MSYPYDQLGALTQSTYTVKKGDTLEAIGRKFNTTAVVIASSNGMSEYDAIYVGQTLIIPGGAGVAIPSSFNPALSKSPTPTKTPNPTSNSDWFKEPTVLIGVGALVLILVLLKRD